MTNPAAQPPRLHDNDEVPQVFTADTELTTLLDELKDLKAVKKAVEADLAAHEAIIASILTEQVGDAVFGSTVLDPETDTWVPAMMRAHLVRKEKVNLRADVLEQHAPELYARVTVPQPRKVVRAALDAALRTGAFSPELIAIAFAITPEKPYVSFSRWAPEHEQDDTELELDLPLGTS